MIRPVVSPLVRAAEATAEEWPTGVMISFKFAAEDLDPEKREVAEQGGPAEVGSLLFQTAEGSRLDYATNARQHGIRWFPELDHSVVYAFADTWACICCRCPRFGCTRPVGCCGFNIYRVSLTRAQWLWAFNFLCFLAHFVMYYLCITSCNGVRFGSEVNVNCTSDQMEVPVYRIRSNCMLQRLEPTPLTLERRDARASTDHARACAQGRRPSLAATSSRSSTTAGPCASTISRRGSSASAQSRTPARCSSARSTATRGPTGSR